MLHLRRDQIRFHARQMSSIAHQEIKSYEISPAAIFKM
jgi:hypothetical protein